MEGMHCYPPGTNPCDITGKILPIFEYPHTDGIAVIGGFIYTGTAIRFSGNWGTTNSNPEGFPQDER